MTCNIKSTQTSTIKYSSGSRNIETHIEATEAVTGYPLYPYDENYNKTGFYIIKPKETINLLKNPTFGINLKEWCSFNSKMIRSSGWSFDEGFSIRVADDHLGEGVKYVESEITDFTANEYYTFSMYLWLPLVQLINKYTGTLSIVDYNGVDYEEVFSSQISKLQHWTRLAVTKLIRSNATNVYARINLQYTPQEQIILEPANLSYYTQTSTNPTTNHGFPYVFTQDVDTVSSMTVHLQGIFSSWIVKGALYSESGGTLTFIADADNTVDVGNTFQNYTFNFSGIPGFSAGDRIYLALKGDTIARPSNVKINTTPPPGIPVDNFNQLAGLSTGTAGTPFPATTTTSFFFGYAWVEVVSETAVPTIQNNYLYADFGVFEVGTEPTTPFNGDYKTCLKSKDCKGYTWLGIPHQSPSKRSSCIRDGGVMTHFSELGFNILNHTQHDAPPVRDVSFSLTDRAGEYHQETVVDARILTLSGYLCDVSLKELECKIFGVSNSILPELDNNKFLLIYHHGECNNSKCDTERDLALCVTYISGLEGTRDNLYQTNAAIQLKAHNPMWFEWPGHTAHKINFVDTVNAPHVLKIEKDGSTRGFPIKLPNIDSVINTLSCLGEKNQFVVGGCFPQINDSSCDKNLALFDCDDFCNIGGGVVGGDATCINTSTTDQQGNVIIGGNFLSPSKYLVIIYTETNSYGSFPDYPGGEVWAVATPFWLQVAVGTDDGVHILLVDDTWRSFVTNGRVRDIKTDKFGNLYAVGDFTIINGVNAEKIARFSINQTGCLDGTTVVWEALNFGFDDTMTSLAIDQDSGLIYVGGNALNVVPTPSDVCVTAEDTTINSKGSSQELTFTFVAGNDYKIKIGFLNIIARESAYDCFTAGDYIRITGNNNTGMQYSFLLKPTAAVKSINGSLYEVEFTVDTSFTLGDPCLTQNPTFVTELNTSNSDILSFTTLTLPGGPGIDNTLSILTTQCVLLSTSYQADNVLINRVCCIDGNNIITLNDGLPTNVSKLLLHPETGFLYAGLEVPTGDYDNGLVIWNGQIWLDFPGLIGTDETKILDIDYCKADCSLYILHESDQPSIIFGQSNVDYNGTYEMFEGQLKLHGPLNIKHLQHRRTKEEANFCSLIIDGERAVFDFGNGKITSNFRDTLTSGLLAGSTTNFILNRCENPLILYGDNDTGCTQSVLIYKKQHWGINALCCAEKTLPPDIIDCCINTSGLNKHRNPTAQDCSDVGFGLGDLWSTPGRCGGLWINIDADCNSVINTAFNDNGNILTDGSDEVMVLDDC
jgi:hypothetical protein